MESEQPDGPRWLQSVRKTKQPRWMQLSKKGGTIKKERQDPVRVPTALEARTEEPRLPSFSIGTPSESEEEEAAVEEAVPEVIDAFASPEEREQRRLCDLLWATVPSWTSEEFNTAHRALVKVEITSIDHLAIALAIDLNRKLADAGTEPFPEDTIKELRRRVLVAQDCRQMNLLSFSEDDSFDGLEAMEANRKR